MENQIFCLKYSCNFIFYINFVEKDTFKVHVSYKVILSICKEMNTSVQTHGAYLSTFSY